MKQQEFDKLKHLARTYNDVDARAKLGALSTDEYWKLNGGYPWNNNK